MAKKYEIGDVHAPVEDTEVPFGLKLLVLVMFLIVGGSIVLLILGSPGLVELLRF